MFNSTKWQFETTTRSINKFQTNVKIKINKNDESNENHENEKNDEKSNKKFSNDQLENEKNDEKTNIVDVIDIITNFANDEKTNIVDVIDITTNLANDEKTNIVDVIEFFLAKLKSISRNNVYTKTRSLMWKVSELINFLFFKIRFTQKINHFHFFFEIYDDLTKKLNNDNENNFWYLTSIFIIDIFISQSTLF